MILGCKFCTINSCQVSKNRGLAAKNASIISYQKLETITRRGKKLDIRGEIGEEVQSRIQIRHCPLPLYDKNEIYEEE